jgi:mono/diheme cytochrome c family protein
VNRRARRPVAVGRLAVVLALAGLPELTGCGGSSAARPLGESVFDAGCATCHSLVGNESLHRIGGDLLGYRLTRDEMLQFVREMPARRPLSPTDVRAVSDYVVALEHRPSR